MAVAIKLVKNKEKLPNIGDIVDIEGVEMNSILKFKVKKIAHLMWNPEGNLIVSLRGRYIKK